MEREFEIGRDLDEFVMSLDRRSLVERVRDLLKKIIKRDLAEMVDEQVILKIDQPTNNL